jgi:Rrf2 family protein
MFSKACEYGIKAIIFIASQSMKGNRVKIGEVSSETNSPEAFTAKVLGALTKHNIVNSHTGPNGGFSVSMDQLKKTKLSDIVFAIDGDSIYKGCALGLEMCNSEKPCPLHFKFAKIRSDLKNMLENNTVFDLATDLNTGNYTLKS